MTEDEWLACEEPVRLLECVRTQATNRNERLLVCAACRAVWSHLTNPKSREAVEVAERFADGIVSATALAEAEWRAEAAWFKTTEIAERSRREQRLIERGLLSEQDVSFDAQSAAKQERAAALAYWATESKPSFFVYARPGDIASEVIRCIFGNPFRPVAFDPSWRTDTAVALAGQMYESRDFGAMPILADALQDAGCDSADVLGHCRGTGPHVRGCWVVDLVLGKQ
jgi:hypothetical protein